MNRNLKTVGAILVALGLLTPLAACDENDGPAERLGESIDKTVEQAGDQLEKAGDEIKRQTD
jgi:hypothetical protein